MTKRLLGLLIAVITLTGVLHAVAQAKPSDIVKRCGWLENPTPANYWLTDADAEWIVSVQGIYQSEGFYDLPAGSLDLGDQWVSFSASGSYGYGCACMDGRFGQDTNYALQVIAAQPLDLEQCGSDPNLPPVPHQ